MTRALVGRGIAFVGIVAGLVAGGLTLIPLGGGATVAYADHGAVAAFLIALLAYSSYLPAEVGQDTPATAAAAVVFGFFLFTPAVYAFNQLDQLGAAAWLGLCTILCPIGAVVIRAAEREHRVSTPTQTPATALRDPLFALSILGVALIAVAIWLPVVSGSGSLWNASASGHALGLLLLLFVVLDVVVLIGPLVSSAVTPYATVIVSAVTFGLVVAPFLHLAFNHLGHLGTGSWLAAIGGLLMFGGVVLAPLSSARRGAAATVPA